MVDRQQGQAPGSPRHSVGKAGGPRREQSSLRCPPVPDRVGPRKLTLLAAPVLATLGAIGLVLAVLVDVPVRAASDSGAASERVARRFYAAIDEAVRTGDLSILDGVVAPELLSDDRDGPACLRCRIEALHQLAPRLQLTIDEVLVDGDRVVIRLALWGDDQPGVLGLPLRGALAPWEPADELRVAEGQVAAVRPLATPPALVTPMAQLDVDRLPPAPFQLGLVRLTLAPGAAVPQQHLAGSLQLIVEQGTLGVDADRPAAVSRRAPGGVDRQISNLTGPLVPEMGDQIGLVDDTGYTLRNLDTGPTAVLAIAALPSDGGSQNRWVRGQTLDEALFLPGMLAPVSKADPPPTWPTGVHSELLAHGVVLERPSPAARLTVTQMTLPRDVSLPPHDVGGGELLAVTGGTAVVDLTSGKGAVRTAAAATLVDVGPDVGNVRQDLLINPGGGAILQPEARVGIRNVGDGALGLLILSLEPRT